MSSSKQTAHSPLLAAADSKTASANPTAATSTTTATNKSRGSSPTRNDDSPAAAAKRTTTTPTTTPPGPIRTQQPPPPKQIEPPKKADTNYSWGSPAGLKPRTPTDENLVIFRRALGINTHFHTSATCQPPTSSHNDNDSSSYCTLEEGRKTAVGIYATVIRIRREKVLYAALVTALMYFLYLVQVILGASLTALSASGKGRIVVTVLGASNTVIAGILALIKGSGQPLKFSRDAVEYGKLRDWIEETEALIVVGVVGRDRKEVGVLVESAFRMYNAAKESEENNKPDRYTVAPQQVGDGGVGAGAGAGAAAGMGGFLGGGGGKVRLG